MEPARFLPWRHWPRLLLHTQLMTFAELSGISYIGISVNLLEAAQTAVLECIARTEALSAMG